MHSDGTVITSRADPDTRIDGDTSLVDVEAGPSGALGGAVTGPVGDRLR